MHTVGNMDDVTASMEEAYQMTSRKDKQLEMEVIILNQSSHNSNMYL